MMRDARTLFISPCMRGEVARRSPCEGGRFHHSECDNSAPSLGAPLSGAPPSPSTGEGNGASGEATP